MVCKAYEDLGAVNLPGHLICVKIMEVNGRIPVLHSFCRGVILELGELVRREDNSLSTLVRATRAFVQSFYIFVDGTLISVIWPY